MPLVALLDLLLQVQLNIRGRHLFLQSHLLDEDLMFGLRLAAQS